MRASVLIRAPRQSVNSSTTRVDQTTAFGTAQTGILAPGRIESMQANSAQPFDTPQRARLADSERRGFLGILEDRNQVCSTILASQLAVAKCHEQIGDSTLADRIPDRLLQSAHRVEHCKPD